VRIGNFEKKKKKKLFSPPNPCESDDALDRCDTRGVVVGRDLALAEHPERACHNVVDNLARHLGAQGARDGGKGGKRVSVERSESLAVVHAPHQRHRSMGQRARCQVQRRECVNRTRNALRFFYIFNLKKRERPESV
jgi:hypothetical protein